MSSYTMQLREIIEHYTQDRPDLSHRERIEVGRKKLFDFDYPFFSEARRPEFETHFIRHFYMREIGFETEGLFKFYLETWLIINMPYFNKLFESELLEFDPFISYDLLTTYERDLDKNENGTIDTLQTGTSNKSNDVTSHSTATKQTDASQIINGESTKTGSNDTSQTNDNTNSSNRLQTTDSNQTDTARTFERDLKQDTPDNRLAITTNDGSGVIEYASQIDEKLNTSNATNKVDGTITNVDTTTDSGITTSSSNTTDTDVLTSTQTNNQLENDQTQVISGERGNESTSITGKNDSVNNEKQKENYSETKRGSIGVKTYSEMLNEYRTTFLRVERDLFREMNQLFMLIY